MRWLDSILKSTDITLLTKFHIVMYGCEIWTIKKAECSCGTYTQWNITQLLKRMHLNQF